MLKPIDFLREIEENYEVEKIKAYDIPVWQVLRVFFANKYESKTLQESSGQSVSSNFIGKITTKVNNFVWNIGKYNKSYKYMLFTDRLEERTIFGSTSDKIAHNILDIYGEDILEVINPLNTKHNNINQYKHKEKISSSVFETKRLLKKADFSIENKEILDMILEKYDIKINYIEILGDFFKYRLVFKEYLNKKKPKLIFVNCYYILMHQALIYAAHENGIKVVELQHGIINNNHFAYNIFKNIGKDTFADYMLVFGDYFKNIISGNYIDKSNIYPIGSFYLEYVSKNCEDNRDLAEYFNNLRKKYKYLVVITSQITIEDKLINLLKEAADKDNSILYIFIPRYFNKDFGKYQLPENIVINEKIDFYHTVPYCDYHSTVYSTCALESLYFAIPNILINIENLSIDNFGEILDDKTNTVYVDNASALVHAIKHSMKTDKNSIRKSGEKFYLSDNRNNISKAMKEING